MYMYIKIYKNIIILEILVCKQNLVVHFRGLHTTFWWQYMYVFH